MPKITSLADLRKIKESASDQTAARSEGRTRVIVGLGTCGIAAGARTVMQAIMEELQKRSLNNVSVETTGCIGMCQQEPLVDVIREGASRITYGRVTPADAARIVSDHIVNGTIVKDLVIGRAD
ncbi:MAG: (2Fe-2S) ferredoxin domain-containing protein [Synergistaceae bacterium]|jgi:NADP-reducing hydrogenase subunit HndB|nr:(2Fe-2S) ferredoxin domain-containing protein [Synergistaceae bacterium]